jgi:hypothetical protein
MGVKSRRLAVIVGTVVAVGLGAALAHAELVEHGDLFVKFKGGIAPNALPRHLRAPISVSVGGTVKTLSGQRPPGLRRIAIAINRGGHLDTRGLPVCHRDQIDPSTSEEALAECRQALVGTGSYVGAVALPEQSAFPARGQILAFNTVIDGQHAILAHVYGASPIPNTRIIVFHIRETGGTYGTIFSGTLPAKLNRYGYVKRISLNLHRNFTYRGHDRSYLSAACSAPPGFPGASFPFARTSMTFADGRKLSSTLTRSCRVRG